MTTMQLTADARTLGWKESLQPDEIIPPGDWEYGFFVVVGLLAVMVAWGFIHSRILDWL